jgi:hypothetical protein
MLDLLDRSDSLDIVDEDEDVDRCHCERLASVCGRVWAVVDH